MRKNRLIWNIVLFLISVIALPIAYAQFSNSFTGSRLFLILINSAIVFVVLFILQSFLIPGKSDKEKTSVWVIMLLASLLIGWFFGSQGFLWQHPVLARFVSIYVLVNTFIIGVVLYFLSGFFDINKKLGSPEGKGGLGIIIFIIAALFAVNIGNQWIWHQSVVKQFVDYLFGAQGLLNPSPPEYRLWAFLSVTTLLAFFFNGYLLKGGAGGTNKVNYALALLIGSSVARAGISFSSVVLLGEVIFTIVLAEALKGTAPEIKGKSTNWLLAAFLVGWASAAMTYGTEYQGWLAGIVGAPLWALGLIQVGPTGAPAQPSGVGGWFGWIAKMGGGAIVFLVLIPLLFFFIIARGENRRRILTLGLAGIKKRINAIINQAKFYRETPEGREPQVFRENRILLHALANYTTRSEITYRYWGFVKQGKRIGTDILKEKIKKHTDQKLLRKDTIVTRTGGVDSEGAYFDGWNALNLEAVDLVNEFFKVLYLTYISASLKLKGTGNYKNEDRLALGIQSLANDVRTKIISNRQHYKERMDAIMYLTLTGTSC